MRTCICSLVLTRPLSLPFCFPFSLSLFLALWLVHLTSKNREYTLTSFFTVSYKQDPGPCKSVGVLHKGTLKKEPSGQISGDFCTRGLPRFEACHDQSAATHSCSWGVRRVNLVSLGLRAKKKHCIMKPRQTHLDSDRLCRVAMDIRLDRAGNGQCQTQAAKEKGGGRLWVD